MPFLAVITNAGMSQAVGNDAADPYDPGMEFTPAQASEILLQIQNSQWKWLKIKRFIPEAFRSLESRYAALEKHHAEETGRMIEVISGLCRTIAALEKNREAR